MTRLRGRTGRQALLNTRRNWLVLCTVLLAVLGGSAPSAAALSSTTVAAATAAPEPGAPAPAAPDESQTSPDGHASLSGHAPPRLLGVLAHPSQVAGHPGIHWITGRQRTDRPWSDGHVLPAPAHVSAAHLTHHTPRHGRAPPPRTGS